MTYKISPKNPPTPPSSAGASTAINPVIPKIDPAAVRYVRLGRGGQHAEDCIAGGFVGLSYKECPHDLCISGDWQAVEIHFRQAGKTASVASNYTGQLRDFYTLGAEALWITFWDGKLWWAFAEPAVTWETTQFDRLPRCRRTIGSWRCTDIAGREIPSRDLSTRLTCLTRYQGTLCKVEERDYVVRRINSEEEPLIVEAAALQAQLTDIAGRLIAALHWHDFEILVDRIFADSGWRRVGVLGETQADADLLVEQLATGERAFVQVKSRATPAVLDDYAERFRDFQDCDRMFFICHSPTNALLARAADLPPAIELWFGETLADKTVRAGLFEWLVSRVR